MSELLQLEQVGKSYRRGGTVIRVLERESLHLARGEVLSVLASRGQGKSTLLRIAAGMEQADHGRVLFNGQELGCMTDRQLSRLLGGQIAWAGRDGPAMAMRMLDYVAMPLLAATRPGGLRARLRKEGGQRGRRAYTRAQDALQRVGAEACANRGWDEISDWERSLVEIAQAIAPQPQLLLIDDITDGLGIRETDELSALIRELAQEMNTGVLMGVSDGQAALRSDRIVALGAGRLSEAGAQSGNVIEFPDLAQRSHGRGGL